MRVAFVAEETAHHRDGDGTERTRRLAERLADRGHEITWFCSQWWEGTPMEFLDGDVTYHAVTEDLSEPGWRFGTRLPGIIRAFEPDLIHAVHSRPAVTVGAKLAGLRTRSPLICEWYEMPAAVGGRGRWNQLAARLPGLVVVPSIMVQTAVRELGRSADGMAVIPNAIDMDAIRAVDPDPVADIVYSRELDSEANLESLLLALAELRMLDWTAAVIGDGPARGKYEDHAADLRIDDRVTFLGAQPIERRCAIFRGARVYVHPAYRTSFPTDLLRALACGCVAIAEYHAASSAHELVANRPRGIRTTGGDELVEALRSAAERPRTDIDETFAEFDEDVILDRYLDHYRELRESYGAF